MLVKTQCLAMRASIMFVVFAVSTVACAQGWFPDKTIAALGGGDTRPCVFFTLQGVTEAVAAVPGSPWFVLPKIHSQFKETFALLLSAKLTGKQVHIATTGVVHACGHAEVVSVQFAP